MGLLEPRALPGITRGGDATVEGGFMSPVSKTLHMMMVMLCSAAGEQLNFIFTDLLTI